MKYKSTKKWTEQDTLELGQRFKEAYYGLSKHKIYVVSINGIEKRCKLHTAPEELRGGNICRICCFDGCNCYQEKIEGSIPPDLCGSRKYFEEVEDE